MKSAADGSMFQKALDLQNKKQYPLAVVLYEQCLEKATDEAELKKIRKALAECYLYMGESVKAKKVLND